MKAFRIDKKAIKIIILLFLFALLIEIFVFNHRSFSTAGYDERQLDVSYNVELVGGSFDTNGDIVMNSDTDFVTLNIQGFGYPLNNIRLDVECLDDEVSPFTVDHVCIAECRTYDEALFERIDEEGHSYLTEGAVATYERRILHSVKESHYIYLEPFGDTHRIQIVLYPVSGASQRLRIHDLTFNAVRPFDILPVRVVGIFLVWGFLYVFFFNSLLWKENCSCLSKHGRILIIIVFVAFALFSVWLVLMNKAIVNEEFSPYSRLAQAICDGRLYVEEAPDELLETEGKSVFWRQDSTQVLFDYSLYKGHYYVYFGVLPCLIFYLPYHIITGGDMPNIIPEIILRLLFVALLGKLLFNTIKRYYSNIPLALFLLLWGALTCGAYIPAMLVGAIKFYDIPIFMGAVLTLGGACFWSNTENGEGKISIGRLALGSMCMALVSLCRPTMLLYGFILLGFWIYNRISAIKQQKKAELLRAALAVGGPYILVAILCMVYNALRFGSPLDFGVNYNATTIPLAGAKLFLPYVIFRSVFEYLLYPPFLDFEFPFTKMTLWERIRQAGNIMVMDVFGGGLIAANPFTWILVSIGSYKERLKKKKLWLIMIACLIAAFIMMIYGVVCTSSIYTRYTLDFAPAVLLSAAVMVLELYTDISETKDMNLRNTLRKITVFVLMVSLWWGVMQFCCGETSTWSLSCGNTELWYKVYYALRVFG